VPSDGIYRVLSIRPARGYADKRFTALQIESQSGATYIVPLWDSIREIDCPQIQVNDCYSIIFSWKGAAQSLQKVRDFGNKKAVNE